MGLYLTLGYAGQVSLAQASFVGIGAYSVALLGPHGVPFGLSMAVGALLSFVVGWGLGFPALRVKGHYLAFVTLAFTTLVFLVMRNEAWLTGGINGVANIERPRRSPRLTPITSSVRGGWRSRQLRFGGFYGPHGVAPSSLCAKIRREP